MRATSVLDDAALLELAARGDAGAFAVLHARHYRVAIATARRFLPPGEAEDVAQEAFIGLWRSADRHRAERGTVLALLTVMVRSRALDRLRRNRAHADAVERHEVIELSTARVRAEAETHRRDQARDIATALNRLPDDQHHVVRLVYLDGHTHAEVANELGIPLGTAKGRSRLGLAKLRDELAHHAPAA